jgi:hypothetical protein
LKVIERENAMNAERHAHTADTELPRTLVLLDPTSPDGEAGLALLDADDTHVAVVVLLSGRASHALREYANAERIDLATAGWNYTQSVADRLRTADRVVEAIVAIGPDPAVELLDLAEYHPTRRVIVPPSTLTLDRAAARRLIDGLPAVTVASPALV